jgi:putative spermidine/putrescine transport system permease protein
MRVNLKPFILSTLVLFILFPFAYLALLSLAGDWRFPDVVPAYFGFRNWRDILQTEAGLLHSFLLSVSISLAVAISATLLGFFISRLVHYSQHQRLLTMLSYFPYVLAPVVFAACLSFFFLKLNLFGKASGVVVAQFMVSFPYALIFFGSFWGNKTHNLEALVSTLGGNLRQTFVKVLLPMAKGMLLVCFFQTFLISWFEYGLTSIIGVGKVQTLTIKVFLFIKEANFYYGALSCILLILPPVVLLYVNKRYVFNKLV